MMNSEIFGARNFTRLLLFAGAFIGSLAVASGARAAMVYENPFNNALAADAGAYSHTDQKLAGEFILGAGTNVNRATWYGTIGSFSAGTDPLNTGDTWSFMVNFHSDASGLPGGVLASGAVSAAVTDAGLNVAGLRAYLFDATFTDVPLLAATSYWFSVLNTGTQSTFRWTEATAGLKTAIALSSASPWIAYPVDFSDFEARTPLNFALYDAAPDAVPLPAALPLFATGLGVLGWLGWRRKRKGAGAAIAA